MRCRKPLHPGYNLDTAEKEVAYILKRRGCDVLVTFVPREDDQVDDELTFSTPDGENVYPFAIQLMNNMGRQFCLVEYEYENGELVGGTHGTIYDANQEGVLGGWPNFSRICTTIAEKVKGHVFEKPTTLSL